MPCTPSSGNLDTTPTSASTPCEPLAAPHDQSSAPVDASSPASTDRVASELPSSMSLDPVAPAVSVDQAAPPSLVPAGHRYGTRLSKYSTTESTC